MPPAPPDPPVGRARGPVGRAAAPRDRFEVEKTDSPIRSTREAVQGSVRSGARTFIRTSARRQALETLLVDLGPQIRRGGSLVRESALRRAVERPESELFPNEPTPQTRVSEPPLFDSDPTGIPALDAHLGGGVPRGRLSEILGPPSSGRTALALGLLSETLRRGVLAAWVDRADAFDPASAAACIEARGGDLEQLLWVRARGEDEALRSCDRLLQTQGFALIVLDLSDDLAPALSQAAPRNPARVPSRAGTPDRPDIRPPGSSRRRPRGPNDPNGPSGRSPRQAIRDVTWLRLARLAASTRTTLLVISEMRRVAGSAGAESEALASGWRTGARADLVLEMQPLAARFVGPPPLLERLETTAILRRHRGRPIGQEVAFSLDVEPELD